MRARTAFVIFLSSILAGGFCAFLLGFASDASLAMAATRTKSKARKAAVSADTALAWREFGPALDEAKASGKTIVMDVYTDWCGWCKRMDRDTYSKPEVKSYLQKNFVPVRLNAEADKHVSYLGKEYSYRELSSGLRVTGYPATIFFASDGKHLATAPGYMGAADFLFVLRYFGDGHYKTKTFQQYQAELEAEASADSASAAKTP